MIIIADSGSTKTDWRVINGSDDIEQFNSIGLNPNFKTSEEVYKVLKTTFSNHEKVGEAAEVYFYGAGCSTAAQKAVIQNALALFFKKAAIHVEHDLLGAARAACHKQSGIAAILGTGSNACSFDGTHIIQTYPSGGFLIGDEGGGVNIGKRILKSYIEEYMPEALRKRFDFQYRLNLEAILANLYEKEQANLFMASFSHFAHRHKENAFIAAELMEEFQQFFDHQILRFDQAHDWPLSTVGSVGYYYHEFVAAIAEKNGVRIGTVVEKPIAALSLYHSELSGE